MLCRRTILYLDHFKVRKSSFSRGLSKYFSPSQGVSHPLKQILIYIAGREESLREAEIEYRIHLLRLRADESQKVQLDSILRADAYPRETTYPFVPCLFIDCRKV